METSVSFCDHINKEIYAHDCLSQNYYTRVGLITKIDGIRSKIYDLTKFLTDIKMHKNVNFPDIAKETIKEKKGQSYGFRNLQFGKTWGY